MHNEIKTHMTQMAQILETKGYDRAEANSLTFGYNFVKLSYEAIDDFQQDLPNEYRVEHGYYCYIHEPTIEAIYAKLRALPSRKMRELQVLARQTSGIGKHLEELQSEQARVFAQEIFDSVAALHDAIEDLRGRA